MNLLRARLRKIMDKQNITAGKLGRLSDLSAEAIHKILRGDTKAVNSSTAQKLAKGLGVSPQFILFGTDDEIEVIAEMPLRDSLTEKLLSLWGDLSDITRKKLLSFIEDAYGQHNHTQSFHESSKKKRANG